MFSLSVSSELLTNHAVMLVCEGLDTVATVKVNGQTVGTSNNMFIRYVYDIKSALVVSRSNCPKSSWTNKSFPDTYTYIYKKKYQNSYDRASSIEYNVNESDICIHVV